MAEKDMALTSDKLEAMIRGWQTPRIILSAAELNVFLYLETPASSDKVARAVDCEPRFIDRLLNALTVIGLVRKDNELFVNTDIASRHLVPGKAEFMAGISHINHMWDSWSRLTDVIRTGKPSNQLPNPPQFDNWLDAFITAMQQFGSERAPAVIDRLDLSKVKSFLDVGGGSGAFSVELAKRFPDMDICVFDLPEVIPLTRRFVEQAQVRNIRYAKGNFLDPLPEEDFDMAFMSHVIHSNSPVGVQSLFRNVFRALATDGQAVVHDFIVDEDRTGPPWAVIFALNMLVNTNGGDTFTESEVRTMLTDEGFVNVERFETGMNSTLITCRKGRA